VGIAYTGTAPNIDATTITAGTVGDGGDKGTAPTAQLEGADGDPGVSADTQSFDG